MAYTLLYSRNIASDARVRFTDVPITSSSIMVDVLSLRSPYYRIAGYAYSIVSDGLVDYERGTGHTLPFGKNRLLFPSSPLPYYLEFFPKWGTKQAIISVYTGSAPSDPPPGVWKQVLSQNLEFRLAVSPSRIEYRTPIGSPLIRSMGYGAIAGAVSDNGYMVWKTLDEYRWLNLSSFPHEHVDEPNKYDQFLASSDSILL